MAPVIIFGPTGNIGSVAARTAGEQGAEVVLAMRDTNKTIPGLDEKAGNFKRVQADLSDAKSVENAVKSSGAKRAFAYLAFGTPDAMKATFQAMKDGGVEFVVFLSSFTIADRALDRIPQSEVIPWVHAQAEISLHAVYGADNFVAVRPGGFATNILRWKDGIVEGHVKIFGEDFEQDCITAGDMGRVSGTILVAGPKNGQKHVYLYGPQLLSQQKAIEKIADALGKEVKLTSLDAEEGLKVLLGHGMPKPVADYIVRATVESRGKPKEDRFTRYDEGVENVKLYTGKPSTGFDEWVAENKAAFT